MSHGVEVFVRRREIKSEGTSLYLNVLLLHDSFH